MLYHVTRNGQNYGPYTLEDLQRYVASGNVLPSDLARSEEMAEWVPVGQLSGSSAPGVAVAGTPYAGAAVPAYPAGAAVYPDPPNLHWALVLLIGFFTFGLFVMVWDFVESAWMRKVDPRSKALFLYIAAFAVNVALTFVRFGLLFGSAITHNNRHFFLTNVMVGLGQFVVVVSLLIWARFDMRSSLEEHFNGPEPIGLSLGPVMTFFFGGLYFQYHFTRINELKRLARYRGAVI